MFTPPGRLHRPLRIFSWFSYCFSFVTVASCTLGTTDQRWYGDRRQRPWRVAQQHLHTELGTDHPLLGERYFLCSRRHQPQGASAATVELTVTNEIVMVLICKKRKYRGARGCYSLLFSLSTHHTCNSFIRTT